MSGTESQPICFESQGRDYCQGVNPWATELLGQKACAACLAVAFESQAETIVELKQQASSDPLTEVLNIRAFNEIIDGKIKQGKPFGLLMTDLEKFKKVNEREQHYGGNLLLILTANYLVKATRKEDVGRLGGDEFMILLDSPHEHEEFSTEDLEATAKRLTEGYNQLPEVARYNQYYKGEDPLSMHMGRALWLPGMTREQLFRAADPDKGRKPQNMSRFDRIKGWVKFLTNSSNV